MKTKIKFILLPILLVMGLCGCFPSNPAMNLISEFQYSYIPGSSTQPGKSSDTPSKSSDTPSKSSQESKSSSSTSKDPSSKVKVVYLINYNGIVTDPWATDEVIAGTLLTRPIDPTSADCPDPAYPIFLGWSKRPLVDDVEDLWNFATDTFEYQSNTFYMYGIWVCE